MDAIPATRTASASTSKKLKRYRCHRCDRLFARAEHLQRHERTHTLEKPFSCTLCNSRFSRGDLLTRHGRLAHRRHDNSSSQLREEEQQHAQILTDPDQRRLEYDSMRFGGLTHQQYSSDASQRKHSFSAPQRFQDPLTTLSLAAEQTAVRDGYNASQIAPPNVTFEDLAPPESTGIAELATSRFPMASELPPTNDVMRQDDLFNDFTAFLEDDLLSANYYPCMLAAEQPMPFFSPESFVASTESSDRVRNDLPNSGPHDSNTFSRYGSRLPSLEPQPHPRHAPEKRQTPPKPMGQEIRVLGVGDMESLKRSLSGFANVLLTDFLLPSRLALSRYVGAYYNCFSPHLPFIHIATTHLSTCGLDLVLAMAAVGTQYCLESERGIPLFHAARAIASERIRRRDQTLSNVTAHDDSRLSNIQRPSEDLLRTTQALLILMAMATWVKHKEIVREALAIQSVLAILAREDSFNNSPRRHDTSWEEWALAESRCRTKLVIYCFLNLHCIVYNIPSLILTSELNLALPCTAAQFAATTAESWAEINSPPGPLADFQTALRRLFARGGHEATEVNSSFGNYVLIHALIQHLFLVRQNSHYSFNGNGELRADDVASLERAIRNWQLGWNHNSESSLDTLNPNGPVAFNSTALLRLAYIRLSMDTGPCRALDTRDPVRIAKALYNSPVLTRTPKTLRAVLHSAHALSIPIKIGIHLVARTQTFIWSIQHSICTLECALLLSKWLQAVAVPDPDPLVSDEERRIGSLIRSLLDETDFALPADGTHELTQMSRDLSVGVLRVWATIFKGGQTWGIVDVVRSALDLYADILMNL